MTGNFARQVMFAAATAGLVFGIGSYAHAATITFDTQPTGAISSFTEAGYTISSVPGDPGDIATIVNVGAPNQNVVVDGNPNDVYGTLMVITKTGGGSFNLVSLDVANLDNPGSPIPVSPGGGFRIEVSGVPGGDDVYGPGSSTFVTESPTDLTNISQLDINIVSYTPEAATFAVDNIVLSSTVPEPSTWAMMLLGFAGLGYAGYGARRAAASAA
ncbi:MAG: PEP-CTERM sorting domain-containing protein [Roseiarcus sp.]|uniref:PEP-CTERM sorting domain-containing protein n=1 Tax=Roseiarcus sp. TaxID=1969460 RepID=UPI003BAEEB68